MTNIILFPRSQRLHKVQISSRHRHVVAIRVVDGADPAKTRWKAQRAIQNASGFQALNGFDDALAIAKGWHIFGVRNARIAVFARQISSLILGGLVRVRIDGKPLRRRLAA